MSDDRLRALFRDHAPAAASPAESAAALAASRARFIGSLERRRIAMTAASLGVVLSTGVGALVLTGDDTGPVEFAVPASSSTSVPVTTERFVTPGGSVDAAVDDGELTLVGSMAADGYVAMVDVMTAARLEVSFRGAQTHVLVLELDADGAIVEVDDAADEPRPPATPPIDEPSSAPIPPSTTSPAEPAAPSSTTPAPESAPPDAPPPDPPPTDVPPSQTTLPAPAQDDNDNDDDGPGWDWGWNPGKGWDWDWNPGNGWDWNWDGEQEDDDD